MAQTYQDLRGVELVKQDSAKYLYRRRKLLQKLDNKKKFTLVKGGTVIFDTWPKDIQAILYGKYPQNTKEADNIILTSNRLGNFSLRDLKKTKEFGGGGTRGSTADTKTTENLQCVYLVAKYEGKTYDEIDLRKVKFSGDLTTIQTLDKWQKLSNPEEWHLSSMAIADAIHSEFGGSGWTFRRGDSWVKDIYALYNKFNKDAKFIFSQSDKWNPADIWMTKGAPMPGKEDSVTDILTLNLWLENQYTLKTIIPISLKQHIGSGPVKLERKNQRFWLPSDYKFDGYTISKRDYNQSKYTTIYFNNDKREEIIFRALPAFVGEIQGKGYRVGKITYSGDTSPLGRIIKKHLNESVPTFETAAEKFRAENQELHDEIMQDFYATYKKIVKSELKDENAMHRKADDQDTFYEKIKNADSKDKTYKASKYIGMKIIQAVIYSDKDQRNAFIASVVQYAKSESELSSFHIVAT